MRSNLRHLARDCVARARALLATGDEPSVRYACLELRFAIEFIAYSHLEVYLAEVSAEAVKKWTPRDVISEMLAIDPQADQPCTVSIGLEESPGVQAKEMHVLGTEHRFSAKWANAHHNALGNFLHAPTLGQIEDGRTPSVEVMARKAGEVTNAVQAVLDSPVWDVNMGNFYFLVCECGRQIKRREGSFTPEEGIVCPACRATYDIVEHGAQPRFAQRKRTFTCPACTTTNYIGAHRFRHGVILICAKCKEKVQLEQGFALVRIPEPKE